MFSVIVCNVGTVLTTKNLREARLCFRTYVDRSKSYYGRCAGECVVLMDDVTGDIIEEYFAPVPPDPQSV